MELFFSVSEMFIQMSYPHGHLYQRQNPDTINQTSLFLSFLKSLSLLFWQRDITLISYFYSNKQISEPILSITSSKMATSAAAYMIMLCMNEYDCIISCSNSQIPLLRRKGKKNLFIIIFFCEEKKNDNSAMQNFFISTFSKCFCWSRKLYCPVKLAWQILKKVALLAPLSFVGWGRRRS